MLVEKTINTEVINLLFNLIQTPSLSKNEAQTAALIQSFLQDHNISFSKKGNNIWSKSKYWDAQKPTVLLNSHHDTVKPVNSWTRDPFHAFIENGKLYGLGSNDAGGCLIALLATFLNLYETSLPFNLVFAATAEEEISGKNGIASIIDDLGKIDFAIIGEPTQMQMAIAEKGLIVIDALATGKSGHAARNEGENAILKALIDIQWLQNFSFPKVSPWLGKVKCSTTQIKAGSQHNVVPDQCHFVIDVRTTEQYTNEEIFNILQKNMQSKLVARSLRLQASGLKENHPFITAGKKLGLQCYGSPTLSDQALLPFPSIKIGPGDSARSHTADEFIYLAEIEQGIQLYQKLLLQLKF